MLGEGRSHRLLAAVALLACGNAWGYHLSDHRRITRAALMHLRTCLPSAAAVIDSKGETELVDADLSEDLNLIRKWTHYSHYYNPFKTLDMSRADSSETIREVEASLKQSQAMEDVYDLLGRAIHHIQDATVPAHVEPVSHWLEDGFESFAALSNLPVDCGRMAGFEDEPLLDLLRNMAMQTDSSLDQEIEVSVDGSATRVSWREGFWTPSNDHSFGRYGRFGNWFGKTEFKWEGKKVEVPVKAYLDFKRQQLNRAVIATEQALVWYLRLKRPEEFADPRGVAAEIAPSQP